KLDQAMDLAGRLLGATAPKFLRLEAMCQEYVAAHPVEAEETVADWMPLLPGGPPPDDPRCVPVPPDWLEPLREALERETSSWALLEAVEPVESPRLASLPDDAASAIPRRIDAELRDLAAMRQRWDGLLGHLAMLVRRHRLWRDLGFASFGHYCVERLGMAARTVEQRAWLAGRLCQLPSLRAAMEDGRICYEKARLLAVSENDAGLGPWIGWAERQTCIEVRRATECKLDRQMCARNVFRLRVPRRVRVLVEAAFRAARKIARCWLPSLACLLMVAEHFIATWKDEPAPRHTPQRRAIERGLGWCQVPGCSLAAVHAHHIVPRARGGGDEDWNLVGLCAGHHLHGVHRGWVRVRGRAPDKLTWELGELEGEEVVVAPDAVAA
ncbi:MAG TPA: HNH endonuclease signature motif containing protein, partial [Anaeromyxobacteraceae bacterium]|nr:HNH endonuclease signature motif containing protein [Anaeromyxobacteraceae bacterium]